MKRLTIYILTILCLTSCDWLQKQKSGDVIAQVGDKVLYESDLINLVPIGSSPEDSLRIVNQYIQQWATNQILYQKAVRNSGQKDEIEAMVENYRRLLYVHEYEQNLLQRRLPDSISETQISQFYQSHKDLFLLKESLIKGMYIVVNKNSRDVNKLISWMRNPTKENMEKIEAIAFQKSLGYNIFFDQWQSFSEIKSHIPFSQQGTDREWLTANDFLRLEDSELIYILRITDKLFVGEQMPYEFAHSEIIKAIQNSQQVNTLKRIEQEIYQDGVENGDIYLRNALSLEQQLESLNNNLPQQVEQTDSVPAKTPEPIKQQQVQQPIQQTPKQATPQNEQQPKQINTPTQQPVQQKPVQSKTIEQKTEQTKTEQPTTIVPVAQEPAQQTTQPTEENNNNSKATFDSNIFN